MNKLMGSARQLMDGYDVEWAKIPGLREYPRKRRVTYRAYRFERPKVGKPVKVYKFGYPDYKSMITKHPELKVLQLT